MSLDFDGLSVSPDQILPILREAAGGSVRVQDVDAAQNPQTWALAFAHAAAQAYRAETAAAVAALMASGVQEEAQLGVEIQRQTRVLDAPGLWPVVLSQAEAGRPEPAALVASTILPLAVAGGVAVDARALGLLEGGGLAPRLRDALLALVGAAERDWIFGHLAVVQGASDADTLGRIGAVATALGSAALEGFVSTLNVRLGEAGTPLPEASLQTLAAMVAARRNAGK